MAEEDAMFDPTLIKKKKKKKTAFDIDAALAEGSGDAIENVNNSISNNVADDNKEEDIDDNVDIDLDFSKKKKKKKKPFNMEELESTLPDGKDKEDSALDNITNQDDSIMDDNFDLDFSKTKKKKKKKKDLDELIAEADDKQDDKENVESIPEAVEDSTVSWTGSDRDYTYDELLNRVFEIMRDKNPDMVAGKKQKFVMRPPQVVKIGTKKTSFANFTEICKTLHRQPKHLLDFLLAELGTSGSVDGNSQLIIKGRFQQKQIENVLRRYIKEYVTCHTCRSPDTILQKDTRLFFLQCETCGSRCSVTSIKSGFQAVTAKRAAIRAKTS
ncbi:eukaryotic translation initiation factor 2 subunit 2 isoform X1 [Photinus pyralis]|uniref:eukaryotic translation initiation factor 2 subunit 2 isoform X1 n=1 Tax=Photinus pyralis TaxID=7054 RepID=UPI0012674BB6|nr:eukaryotic translation initiation factor 2 subunit 2 isoform X1 [Photinus pyralis]